MLKVSTFPGNSENPLESIFIIFIIIFIYFHRLFLNSIASCCLFVCLFIYLLTQAGFSGCYAADVGLRPTASFPRVLGFPWKILRSFCTPSSYIFINKVYGRLSMWCIEKIAGPLMKNGQIESE